MYACMTCICFAQVERMGNEGPSDSDRSGTTTGTSELHLRYDWAEAFHMDQAADVTMHLAANIIVL